MAGLPIKKMITEVLLILPIHWYVTLFLIWLQFWYVTKLIADEANTFNDAESLEVMLIH